MNKNDLNNNAVKGPMATMNTIRVWSEAVSVTFIWLELVWGLHEWLKRLAVYTLCFHWFSHIVCHPNSTVYQGGLSMITRGIVMYICLIESMHFSFPVYLRLIILKQKYKRKSLCLWKSIFTVKQAAWSSKSNLPPSNTLDLDGKTSRGVEN